MVVLRRPCADRDLRESSQFEMNYSCALLLAAAALLFAGCESGLESVDTTNRGPAPYSPDFTGHAQQFRTEDPLGAPYGRY